MVSVVEGFGLTSETADHVVIEVVSVIGAVSAVFGAVIAPIVSFVVVGAGVTDGSDLAELGGNIEEEGFVVTT